MEEIMSEFGGSVSEGTKRQYAKKIVDWMSGMGVTLEELLSDVEGAMSGLEEMKIKHSACNHHVYISSVVGYIKHVLGDEKLLRRWKEVERENSEEIRERYDENRPSENQRDKVMELSEIEGVRQSLERGSFERLLLSFYTLIEPIRADYFATELIELGEEAKEDNYIEDKRVLVVRDFKTKRRYEKLENELTSALSDELRVSLERYPRRYLFVMEDRVSPYKNRKIFSNWACKVLKRVLGRPMTLTALRHNYITSKMKEKTGKELCEMARRMGHSRDVQRIYEWKVEED